MKAEINKQDDTVVLTMSIVEWDDLTTHGFPRVETADEQPWEDVCSLICHPDIIF